MKKKVVISAAERLAALKVLPQQKLPSTLRNEILLPNLKEIRLFYRPMCKNIGVSLKFFREFGPAMRFYNPELIVQKKKDENGPVSMTVQVFLKNLQQPFTLNPDEFKTPQKLLQKVKQIESINQ